MIHNDNFQMIHKNVSYLIPIIKQGSSRPFVLNIPKIYFFKPYLTYLKIPKGVNSWIHLRMRICRKLDHERWLCNIARGKDGTWKFLCLCRKFPIGELPENRALSSSDPSRRFWNCIESAGAQWNLSAQSFLCHVRFVCKPVCDWSAPFLEARADQWEERRAVTCLLRRLKTATEGSREFWSQNLPIECILACD